MDCGVKIENTPANTKRCPICAKKAKQKRDREALQEERRKVASLSRSDRIPSKKDRLREDMKELDRYNAQRKEAGLETVTYGKWRAMGAPDKVVER